MPSAVEAIDGIPAASGVPAAFEMGGGAAAAAEGGVSGAGGGGKGETKTKVAVIDVEGMTCAICAGIVENLLGR